MELTYAKCESILATLPIGYYTGRRIDTMLDKEAETSFYSPMEDKIVVSFPIIAHRFSQMQGIPNEEEAIRSMLYHEVSHAVLTPTNMYPTTAHNIFEDERIESVLRHYYHGVDFRKQLYDVHGGHAPEARNTDQAFFNAVRFGLGSAKVQNRVNEILKQYATINRGTKRYGGGIDTANYETDIDRLYNLVRDEFKHDPQAFQPQNGKGQQMQMDTIKQGNSQNGEQDGNTEQNSNDKDNKDGENNESTENRPSNVADNRIEKELSAEEVKRMVGASLGAKPNLSESDIEKLNEFQKTAEMIISNFNKKNSGGSGISAYSGVFNPRSVVRQDYRFFDRAMTTQGNNKFGSCHLNLIIDCSGSYCDNVHLTNGILAVLSEIERKNRNFSLDVAFINHEFHPCKTVRDRKMSAWGGNAVPKNMRDILINMQKPLTCNYNIILFDGDALCNNDELRSTADCQKRFGAFDMKQTTMITDPDNATYAQKFTATKVVITKHYTSELIKHITRALTVAFG